MGDTDSDKEKDNEPSLGEESGKQDWFRAGALIAAGLNVGPACISSGASPASATAGGTNLNGAPLNGVRGPACGNGIPSAALVGTGTLEGTNKYSAPIMGGAGPYGLVPGFTKPWPGTYATYRIASAHPTHVIAGASLVGQVLGSQWSYQAKKNAPSGVREFIQETLEPTRTRLLMECLKAVTTFGCRAFEKVFEYRDGMVRLVKLKPLLPELTDILVDDKGNFAGVRNLGIDFEPEKVFLYTYDQDGDYYYGRPRLENTRRVWSNWLNTEDQLGRLGAKTSSIIPIMRYPPGQGFDSLGQPRTNYAIAVAMAAGLASGRPIVVPNLAGLQVDDLRNLSEFADKSLWGIDTVDMGNPGPAIEALIKLLQYYDCLMVRGMLRPERSLLEQSRGGSRADSETHSNIGISDSDMVHADIVAAINEQVVNQLLELNFGEEAIGTVRIKAAPLSDDKQLLDQEILRGLVANPQGLAKVIAHTDMEAWMDRVGLPKNQTAGEWDGAMTAPSTRGSEQEPASILSFGRGDPPATSPAGDGHWITKDGNHIFIRDKSNGESPTASPATDPKTEPATQPTTEPLVPVQPAPAEPFTGPYGDRGQSSLGGPSDAQPLTILKCPEAPGIEIHGDRFITPARVQDAMDALNRVLATKRGRELLKMRAAQNNPPLVIQLNTHGRDQAPPEERGRIYINVAESRRKIIRVQTPDGPKWVKGGLDRIIAHELAHNVTGDKDDGPGSMRNVNENENPIVTELGRYPRIQYGRTDEDTSKK